MNLLALVFTAMATLPEYVINRFSGSPDSSSGFDFNTLNGNFELGLWSTNDGIYTVNFGYSSGNSIPDVEAQIVGGYPIIIQEVPYLVSVRFKDQMMCEGSIIDNNHVLTSAHCVHGMDQSQLSVRVGNTVAADGKSVRVVNVVNYPRSILANDLSVLLLAKSLNYSNSIGPIQLLALGAKVPVGTTAREFGWGATSNGSGTVQALLRAVNVTVISNTECSNIYMPTPITSHMMCAQTLSQDACQDIPGGPLVANGELIGVMSWGPGCAGPHYPGVYTKVSNIDIYDWIMANTR